MNKVTFNQTANLSEFQGEIEIIIRDRWGRTIEHRREPNIIKIFAKEIISHRIVHDKIFDPDADGGLGAFVPNTVSDPQGDFGLKYILLGASFDDDGVPLDADDARFYTTDPVTQIPVPIPLLPGAEFDGDLINAIPISEPSRPLKRIEKVDFETTFQPAGTPLLQADVRAINNILVVETTLRPDEYNGFGFAQSDFFTITEVALASAKELGSVGACEETPTKLFLEVSADGDAQKISLNGSDVITLNQDENEVDLVKLGDQIRITAEGATVENLDPIGQITPHYLVIGKLVGGRDIQLDRVPVTEDNKPLIGDFGMMRNTLRIFSHRILSSPVRKSSAFEIIIRWRILFS